MTQEKCAYIEVTKRSVVKMYEKYEAAIQISVELMSCGRICGIGYTAQQFLIGLMKPSTSMDDQSVYTLNNDTFSPMTEEAEREGLAMLANKVVEENKCSSLNTIITKLDVTDVFHKSDNASDCSSKCSGGNDQHWS